MNPDAEKVTRQRYTQACTRLQSELRDQIMSRMEHLDEDQSECEYVRQLNELRLKEAKMVLNGDTLVAGDYDWSLSGIYGETDSSNSSSNQEMIPLLKQLLGLLESGKPFVIGGDAAGRGGDTSIYMSNQPHGASGDGPIQPVSMPHQQTIHPVQAPRLAQANLVQRSAGSTTTTSGGDVQNVLVDPSKLTSNTNDPKELHRNLFTKQTYEAAKLENELKNTEISEINAVIEEFEKKKNGVIGDVSADLKKKLAAAQSDEEREKIMLEYAQNMQKLNDALEKQKQQQMEALRRKMLDRRRQEKKDMHRAHITEAKNLGLPADAVPTINVPSHDDMDRDLRLLAQQQEKLLAELAKANAEQNNASLPKYDADMEERIKAMRLSRDTEQRMVAAMKLQSNNVSKQEDKLRKLLASRRERGRKRDPKGLENLTDKEREEVMSTHQVMTEADRLS